MVFALDHADCAAEVVDILQEALTLDETPIPTKVRRKLEMGGCRGPEARACVLQVKSSPWTRRTSPQMWRCVPWGM